MQVKPAEVDTFLKGGGALDINGVRKKPKASSNILVIRMISILNIAQYLRMLQRWLP